MAQLMDQHKSTINRDLAGNTGLNSYGPKAGLPIIRGALLGHVVLLFLVATENEDFSNIRAKKGAENLVSERAHFPYYSYCLVI